MDAFRELKILVELDLSHNNVSDLPAKTFEGNERLQTLDLSHNRISQLRAYQVRLGKKYFKSIFYETTFFPNHA